MSDEISIKDGQIIGPWRRTVNSAIQVKGSIHDEEMASKIGIRGGAVAGTNHLDIFVPLLLKAFGPKWFERGTMSIFYTYMTTDREEVRAVIGLPPLNAEDAQVEARLEMPGGQIVGRGTVSVGTPKEPTYIQSITMTTSGDAPRVFANLTAGHDLGVHESMITQEKVNKRLEITTDPIDWYKGSSPWGKSVLPPQNMHDALQLTFREGAFPERLGTAVGFFGATEIRNINGPILADTPYKVHGQVVFVGVTAKTEFYWYDSFLDDLEGKRIAEMRKMIRVMKSSSDLYQ
ncbi:MAG: hypothetical protein AB1585_12290 [Thermodesulfobacteriota bacterium]